LDSAQGKVATEFDQQALPAGTPVPTSRTCSRGSGRTVPGSTRHTIGRTGVPVSVIRRSTSASLRRTKRHSRNCPAQLRVYRPTPDTALVTRLVTSRSRID